VAGQGLVAAAGGVQEARRAASSLGMVWCATLRWVPSGVIKHSNFGNPCTKWRFIAGKIS